MKRFLNNAVEMASEIGIAAKAIPDDVAKETPLLFPVWDGGGVAYAVGDRVRHNDMLFKCLTAHTSQAGWAPGAAPSLWVRIDDPGEEWPDWRQPTGGHNAYAKGAKVTHNGGRWVSDVDNNVWEPSVYGWTKQEG